MAHFKIGKRGFTLLELLMVVAIIAALAAVALPMLGMYRSRAFNAAAISDLRAFKAVMESAYIDHQGYPNL